MRLAGQRFDEPCCNMQTVLCIFRDSELPLARVSHLFADSACTSTSFLFLHWHSGVYWHPLLVSWISDVHTISSVLICRRNACPPFCLYACSLLAVGTTPLIPPQPPRMSTCFLLVVFVCRSERFWHLIRTRNRKKVGPPPSAPSILDWHGCPVPVRFALSIETNDTSLCQGALHGLPLPPPSPVPP